MIPPGSIVLLHLINPTEKLWGVLEDLAAIGVTVRALNVSSFEDWMLQSARGESNTLGLSTMFIPLFRVERIYLDEQVGAVESYTQRFEKRVGVPVRTYLGLDDDTDTSQPS